MHIEGFRVRIKIQKQETIIDKYGNHKSAWIDYFRCWATPSTQTGQEGEEAAHTKEEDRLDFTVRYCTETAAVTSKQYRILLGDRIYNIVHVDDMGFKHNSRKLHAELVER